LKTDLVCARADRGGERVAAATPALSAMKSRRFIAILQDPLSL
jgi:hypothetical protein